MKRKSRFIARMDEVRIVRNGETVQIQYLEPGVPTTHWTFGPELARMTDEEILEMHNDNLQATSLFASQNKRPAVEVPLSSPQIKFEPEYNHWTARGEVLRCEIGDDEDRMPVIQIDDQELTWEEFGRLVVVYAGWGMRVVFVSDDEIHRQPKIVVREPETM